jgi:hypothetical protein
VVPGLQAGRPADRRLRVGVGRLVHGEHHRRALGGDRDPALTGEDAVEHAGRGEHPEALHHLDVVLHTGVEGEYVLAVDGDRVTGFDVDDVDVGGPVGEEHVTPAGQLHQRYALAGQLRLEPLAHAARAERLELHLPLVGHHGAGPGHHLPVQLDLEHLGVLESHPRLGRLLLHVLRREQCATHDLPSKPCRTPVGSSLGCRTPVGVRWGAELP